MAGILTRSLLASASILTAVSVSGAIGGAEQAAAQGSGLTLKRVGTFERPLQLTTAPRRPRLLYVVEQRGTIQVLRRGNRLARPFLDIRNRVRHVGEAGLLSVAFHPAFPRNRQFYVFYVNLNGNIQIDRFRSRANRPVRTAPGSRRTVLRIAHGMPNHFGGQLAFGPGGLLFASTGDGQRRGASAQGRNSLLGKILRIRPNPRGGHSSPAGNPFVGEPGSDQVYSLGLRNPWRFSLDRRDDDIWVADVGAQSWEEINRTSRLEALGANFGWDCWEASERRSLAGPCEGVDEAGFTFPVHEYPTERPDCAVIGGHVVRGPGPPRLRGRYLFGDFCRGGLRSLDPADPGAGDRAEGVRIRRLSSIGSGRRGSVYISSILGRVHRVVPR